MPKVVQNVRMTVTDAGAGIVAAIFLRDGRVVAARMLVGDAPCGSDYAPTA